jgi:hypothetical protein
LKWSGNKKESEDLLNAQDWSICHDEIQLAKAVLLDDFNKAAQIMKDIGNNPQKISILHYRGWPIFKEFRKTDQFLETYQEIFKEPFDIEAQISSSIIEPITEKNNQIE